MNFPDLLRRSLVLRSGIGIIAGTAVALFLLPGVRMGALGSQNFLPHATCYLQDSSIIAVHAISDSLIAGSYLIIAGILGLLVYKARRDIPFHWVVAAFGLFIVTCGFTHIMAVINIWYPLYWLAADVKIVTATASVATAAALPFVVPRVFQTIRAAKVSDERKSALERAHVELRGLYERVKEVDALKTQFFANVSHELRTPLTLILGPSERLQRSPDLSEEDREDLEGIRRNALRLLKQVNDLLELSRLDAGQAVVSAGAFDLAEVVRLTAAGFRSLARERGVQLTIEEDGALPIEADREKIEQVLLNLISNALKFVPENGSIVCRVERSGERAVLAVEDSGPGVPAEMRGLIFERFRQADGSATRSRGGTGLGLAIAHEFIRLHGGEIHVEDSLLGGARFVVTLPLRQGGEPGNGGAVAPVEEEAVSAPEQLLVEATIAAHARPAAVSGGPADAGADKPLVLVVEDEPEVSRFVARTLAPQARVVTADNGREALEAVQNHRFNLVISDIMMPEMSGDQLVESLRRDTAFQDIPILLLSARADDALKLRLLREGAQDYVVKPFSPEELQVRAANLLESALARQALRSELEERQGNLTVLTKLLIDRKKMVEAALASQLKAEEELRRLNAELESRVAARTADLEAANEELEAFAFSASHDLRSPLRSMVGLAGVLLEEAESMGPRARELADRIVGAGKRMEALIEDLLALSRAGRAEIDIEPVQLDEVCREAIEHAGVEIRARDADVILEGAPVSVLANWALLGQVAGNLLGNALKFVKPGSAPQVRLRCEQHAGRARLTVEDNGIGIRAEERSKVFRPFERLHSDREYEGTGLGLAIVAKAVQRMNGSYGFESIPGEGSRFWVELPGA